MVYHVDYGYLENTISPDGSGVDVYCGSDSSRKVDSIVCNIDLMKRDSEIKLLIGCRSEEKRLILDFHNGGEHIKGILTSYSIVSFGRIFFSAAKAQTSEPTQPRKV